MVTNYNLRGMRRFYWIFAGFLVAGLASCGQRSQTADSVPTVKIDTVAAADEQTTLQFTGKVKAAQDINLAFRVSGMIQAVHVEDGAYVRKGQLLAELDPTDYQIQLDAAEAEYQQVKAEAQRVIALYKQNVTTPDANDKAVYGLKQITAKYNHAKDQLGYTRLYAPFNGYVQKRLFNPHETVSAGMPVLSMLSEGAPEVEINLPAAEYIRRHQFVRYHCTFDVYPHQQYALSLIGVTPKANANQLYTMRLQLKNNGDQPVPSAGMNTMVTIGCAAAGAEKLCVPSGAVFRKEGKTYVYRYDAAGGTIRSCAVNVVRLLSDGRNLITSGELESGDLIVASGVHHIKDGQRVQPLMPAAQTNVGGLL